MERKQALRVVLLSILVSYTVCKVVEKPNHLIAESSQEVTSSAIHADVPLHTRQHKFPVQISTITDAFSSDVERIGSLDARGLLASKNVQKSIKWTTDNKIRNVSGMQKLKFAMRRLARRHNVLKSSHGTGMPSSVSILKDGKDIRAFAYEKTPPSSITGLPYKMDTTVPVKLTILPSKETSVLSVETADAESDWITKQDNSTKQDDKKSVHSNGKDDKSSPHGEPRATGHERSTRHAGTSAAIPRHKMPVHPGVEASLGLRWKAAYDHVESDNSKKGKHFKINKKKSHSEDEEPVGKSSTTATVAGILAGIVISFIFINVRRLWRTLLKRWRRRSYLEFGSNFFLTDYSSEELSEEEIIFDRSVMERNKESSQGFSPRTSPESSLGRSRSATSCYESPGQVTQDKKVWTVTDAPRSTPLGTVPTLNDTPTTEVLTSNEIAKSNFLDSLVITSSLSPTYDLIDKSVSSPFPFTTQKEQITSESSLSSNPSAPNLSFLPTTSEEFTRTGSMATENIYSTKSCKTPVAARNEVVISMEAEGEITYTSYKSQSELLSVVQDSDKESRKKEMLITMGPDDGEESSVTFETESETSLEEMIYTSQTEEMKRMTTSDATIDIMGIDDNDDNEDTSAIKFNQDLTYR